MILKKAQFEQAVQLRKRGFTYSEIAKIVDVSKSTISQWVSQETWSKGITETNKKRASKDNSKRISLLNTARGNQNKKSYSEAERSAETEYRHYKSNPLFIAGLTVYLTEGEQESSHLLRVTSAKMDTHRVFISFCTEYLGVPREKVRFWLLLHEGMSPEVCSRKWSKKIKLPLSRFHKYQVIQGKTTKQTLHFGTGNTIIGSTILKRKLKKWIELLLKDL